MSNIKTIIMDTSDMITPTQKLNFCLQQSNLTIDMCEMLLRLNNYDLDKTIVQLQDFENKHIVDVAALSHEFPELDQSVCEIFLFQTQNIHKAKVAIESILAYITHHGCAVNCYDFTKWDGAQTVQDYMRTKAAHSYLLQQLDEINRDIDFRFRNLETADIVEGRI